MGKVDIISNVMDRWVVSQEEEGMSLQQFIKTKLPEHSSKSIKQIIAYSCCVNGKIERFCSRVVLAADCVSANAHAVCPHAFKGFEKERVLLDDPSYFAYDKPAGIASDAPDFLKACRRRKGDLQLAHRLDRDTSGVLLFAKTPSALAHVQTAFRQRKLCKRYAAIVHGRPPKAGVHEGPIGLSLRYDGGVLYTVDNKKGRAAKTVWQVVGVNENVSCLIITAHTGRTHQIRVHMSDLGFPLLGDRQYGRQTSSGAGRVMLHACSLQWQGVFSLDALLPKDFCATLEKYGIRCNGL